MTVPLFSVSAPSPPPRPEIDPMAIRTDFLSALPYPSHATHLLAGFDAAKRRHIYQTLSARGYTHICLYVCNEGDYKGVARFDFYEQPERLVPILRECWEWGLAPVLWLMPDDAPGLHRKYRVGGHWTMETLPRAIQVWDVLASSYVSHLEADEPNQWNPAEHLIVLRTLDALTERPVGLHFVAGRWSHDWRSQDDKARWLEKTPPCTKMLLYQYTAEEARSASAVIARTDEVANHALKWIDGGRIKFVCGEFPGLLGPEHEARARWLGRAALSVPGVVGSAHGA